MGDFAIRGRDRDALAVASGVLLALSFPKYGHPAFGWIALAPLLIAVTLCLRGLAAPKPLKFLLATLLGASITYLASSFVFRRIPVLKRLL